MFYEYDTKYFDWDNVYKYDNYLYTFDKMPDKMRLTVDFRTGGMPQREIAKIMKVSINTVDTHLKRAKKRILRGAKLI